MASNHSSTSLAMGAAPVMPACNASRPSIVRTLAKAIVSSWCHNEIWCSAAVPARSAARTSSACCTACSNWAARSGEAASDVSTAARSFSHTLGTPNRISGCTSRK